MADEKIELKLEDIKKLLEKKLPEWFSEKLSDSYDNPLKDAVDEAIKSKEGIIKKLVNEILENVLTDPKFKEELGKKVMSAIVQKGLKN